MCDVHACSLQPVVIILQAQCIKNNTYLSAEYKCRNATEKKSRIGWLFKCRQEETEIVFGKP